VGLGNRRSCGPKKPATDPWSQDNSIAALKHHNGTDKPLYIQHFDHRDSFEKDLLGWLDGPDSGQLYR
jgi:hypothetical protein